MKIVMPFIIFIYLLLNVACASNVSNSQSETLQDNMEEEIEKTLKAKYGEGFNVTDQYFDKSLNLYTFTAHPTANSKIVFEGNYDERNEKQEDKITDDAYPNTKFSFLVGEYYESLFPNKQLEHIAQASIYSNYEHRFGQQVPSLDVYLENRPEGSTIRMNTYFFEIPDQPYHQTVVTLFGVMETLQEKFENNYSVYAGFWPKGFLEDKKLNELTFGFESTTQEDADDLLTVMQYLGKEVFIKIVNGSLKDLDEEKMFELIKDYNKNGPTEMVEL